MNQDKNNKPVSPIYVVAMLWLFWPLILPLFTLLHYLPLIVSATVVYRIVNSIRQKKARQQREKRRADAARRAKKARQAQAEREAKKNSTGNPEVDKLIKERDLAISEMRRLNANIPDEKITAQIDDMEATTSRIFDFVIAHPDHVSQISKFLNYYLPTTIKLLNTYDRMGSQGVSGDNISTTMRKVESTLDMTVDAFHKQLDTLFAGEALDVSRDITVMENLMKTEGLADDGMGNINLPQQ